MVEVHTASDVAELADALAEVLEVPPADPMTPDWVAVPSKVMRDRLEGHLSRRLGTTGTGHGDGVAANISFRSPGDLREAVLKAALDSVLDAVLGLTPGEAGDRLAWSVERLAWSVRAELVSDPDGERFGAVSRLPAGATWIGRSKRIADLFDRYGLQRPAMVAAWADGEDVDGSGGPLPRHALWQPRLWRAVRERIGLPSPPELLPDALAALADGALALDLPERVCVFGVSTLPGGAPFVEMADAVGVGRQVHLFLLEPSPGMARAVTAEPFPNAVPCRRASDQSRSRVGHPLLRSWAGPARETALLVDAAVRRGWNVVPRRSDGSDEPDAGRSRAPADGDTLLSRIQADLRSDRVPTGDLRPSPEDRSVQIHAAHGPVRQVEVMRDAILHALVDIPDLSEDDVVVVCPAMSEYAPVIEAVLGRPAGLGEQPVRTEGPPALRYRLAEPAAGDTEPTLAALLAILDVVSGRMSVSEVADLIALPPVRACFDLDTDAVSKVRRWLADTEVRWGLDGDHRAGWGLPVDLTEGTWRDGLDRLLLGVAATAEPDGLSVGDTAPVPVDGGDVELLGRLAEFVARLRGLAVAAARPRPLAEWCDLLGEAAVDLLDDPSAPWAVPALLARLTALGDSAGDTTSDHPLALDELRVVLGDLARTTSSAARPGGHGVTVASHLPLRGRPARVVCVLGLDEGVLGGARPDGDDLAAADPVIGDHDQRGEGRLALLESVLAARDRLVITRTGHSVVTNRAVPPSVPVLELIEVMAATVVPSDREALVTRTHVVHPRQGFDDRALSPGALGAPRPWSFDPRALAAAESRAKRGGTDHAGTFTELLDERDPPEVPNLENLHGFLRRPVRTFLRRRLEIVLPAEAEEECGDLRLTATALERYSVGDRLLRCVQEGGDLEGAKRRERRGGKLPVGAYGDPVLDDMAGEVGLVIEAVEHLGATTPAVRVPIDVELPDGTHLTGTVEDARGRQPGPVRVMFSRPKEGHRLAAWLDLMALTAMHPDVPWWSAVVSRERSNPKAPESVRAWVPSERETSRRQEAARSALATVVDCYRRGMREPLPLFRDLSPELASGCRNPDSWRDEQNGWGDGYEPEHELVFGIIDLDELLALPCRDDDPPGGAMSRAVRWAEHLWGMVGRTSEPVELDFDRGGPAASSAGVRR